jgi:hypothetical protein
MKALRFLRALPFALLLIAPARADQASIVGPTAGPKTMLEVMTAVNAGMLAIQSCNSGTSAPANGPGGVAKAFQCWADTSASPVVTYKTYDGASWVAFGKLNTSTHIWTPVYQGTDAGTASTATTGTSGHTLGFLDGANTWSAVQSFNSAMLSLKGSTSGAGTLNAPAVASTYVWTLPALTDTLVGKATVDTFTNKTFDTAATGNSFSINGLAATANTGTGSVVRATSPTLITPNIGVASATSINGNIWTASSGTLTLGAGKTATISNTLTFAGTDGSTVTLGAGGTVAYLSNTLNAFASTTSAQLATVISDETGSGALVFGTSPTLVTPTLGVAAATSINKVTITAPATGSTLTIPDGVTLTGPAASGTAMTLGNAETVTGAKSFNDATVILKGATSGTTTVKAAAVAGTTALTLPSATDTLVGKATSDVLTNKTFDTAGSGNALAINGLAATANTGTGAVVRAVSPAITTPTGIVKGDVGLGNVDNTSDTTKWAATKTLTNTTFDTAGTGNSFSINGVAATANTGTGAVARAASPVFTGTPAAPTATAGTNTTQIATTQFVTSAVAASTAGVSQFNGLTGVVATSVVVQKFTASGTYTPTAGMLHAIIECQGGGGSSGALTFTSGSYTNSSGGGGGAYARKLVTAAAVGSSQIVTVGAGGAAPAAGNNVGNAGGTTSVGALCSASGGSGGQYAQAGVAISPGGNAGTTGTGDIVVPGGGGGGGMGAASANASFLFGGWGGSSFFSGQTPISLNSNGIAAAANSGGGGAGAQDLGVGNRAGGAGGSGIVIITEFVNL